MISTGKEKTPPEDQGPNPLFDTYSNQLRHKGFFPMVAAKIGYLLGIGFLQRMNYNNKPLAEVCRERLTRLDDLQRTGANGYDINKPEYSVYRDLRDSVGPARAQEILQEIKAREVEHQVGLDNFPGDVSPGIRENMIRRAGRLGAILDIEPEYRGLVNPDLGIKDTDKLVKHAYTGTVTSLSSNGLRGEDVFMHPVYITARLSVLGEANQRFCRDDEE